MPFPSENFIRLLVLYPLPTMRSVNSMFKATPNSFASATIFMSTLLFLERRENLGGVPVIQGVFDVSPQEYFNEDIKNRSGGRTIKQEIT